jgi:hypothetical protein
MSYWLEFKSMGTGYYVGSIDSISMNLMKSKFE